MRDLLACHCCDNTFERGQLSEFHEQYLCHDCMENQTVLCDCCYTRIWSDDNYGDSDTPLCQSCYDRYYTTCESCGRAVPFDDANFLYDDEERPLCGGCFDREEKKSKPIHDYYYKPVPVFFGTGPRFFGVELEVDDGGENVANARTILSAGNSDGVERIYIKRDGSLTDGLEVVSHPASLDYHLNDFPWPDILETAISLGYHSHQSDSCGFHIHVSREAFGDTFLEQDSCIARVLFFVEKHWEELLKFSRRTPRQLERWAARYGYRDQPKDILDHAKKGYHGGRYTCINLENSATVEFRIFRGSLKLNTFLATLQMVNRICDLAISMTDDEIKGLSWTSFVAGCTQPDLVQYLKERRLYVNDPISGEVEV